MPDQRQHPRQSIEVQIFYQHGDGPRLSAHCRDVSLGGMFIETESPLPYGTKLSIFMQVPGLLDAPPIESVVRWLKPGGMGVQFGMMGARETHALTRLLRGKG